MMMTTTRRVTMNIFQYSPIESHRSYRAIKTWVMMTGHIKVTVKATTQTRTATRKLSAYSIIEENHADNKLHIQIPHIITVGRTDIMVLLTNIDDDLCWQKETLYICDNFVDNNKALNTNYTASMYLCAIDLFWIWQSFVNYFQFQRGTDEHVHYFIY